MEPATPLVRPYRRADLGQVVNLWEQSDQLPVGPDGLSVDEAADLMESDQARALVAEHDGAIVGFAVGAVSGVVGTIFRVLGEDEVWDQLVDELESRLAEGGARKLVAGVRRDDPLCERLAEHGYRHAGDRILLERDVPGTAAGPSAVEKLGGELVDPGLWDSLEGMEEAKELIERRVILPLAEKDLASEHGVASPRAIILFGPPGTGKTTFAKGVASRLEWPFIPIEASELAGEGDEQESELLAETFDRILDLPSAVAFVDEVEDIAASRDGERKVGRGVTAEFLRQVPRIRDSDHHLLVCATNWVSELDPAFLRPGRFDYVIPVGPPDEEARRSIWARYVQEITDDEIDLDALVEASALFTPADIEFAARKAAQLAFEEEYFGEEEHRATTDDFLQAIEQSRPTLTEDMIERFERDKEEHARH